MDGGEQENTETEDKMRGPEKRIGAFDFSGYQICRKKQKNDGQSHEEMKRIDKERTFVDKGENKPEKETEENENSQLGPDFPVTLNPGKRERLF